MMIILIKFGRCGVYHFEMIELLFLVGNGTCKAITT